MIALQPFNKDDFDQLIDWIKDEEMLMQFAGPAFHFPLTAAQLEQSVNEPNRISYKIFYTPENRIIGHAELYFTNTTDALLCRILIGEEVYRGKGLGLQITNELLHIAFAKDCVEQASLNVFDWNVADVQCYKKAGFGINEGITKERRVKDQVWIALNMSVYKKTWKEIQIKNTASLEIQYEKN